MPVQLSMEIKGLEEMRKAFEKAPQIVGKYLEDSTKESGKKLVGKAKEEVPIKTGDLRRSIMLSYKPIAVRVFTEKEYAVPVHEGFRAHEIIATRAKFLRFKGRDGEYVYVKKVWHPGFRGDPFMQRTIEIEEGEVNRIFDSALDKIIRELER